MSGQAANVTGGPLVRSAVRGLDGPSLCDACRVGLINWIQEIRTEPDIVWVAGSFHVTASSTPAFRAEMSSGWWTGVLVLPPDTLPPVPPTPIRHHGIAPTAFWPHAGQIVDVEVVPTDLTLIKFMWATATSPSQQGMADAVALAARLSAEPKHDPDP